MAGPAHASENDTDLHGDPDARHWAERFASRFSVQRRAGLSGAALSREMIDVKGLMLTWFAGAIETGKRHAPPPAEPDFDEAWKAHKAWCAEHGWKAPPISAYRAGWNDLAERLGLGGPG